MGILVSQQSIIFLAACLLGAGLGLIYDVFRVFRLVFRQGRLLILAEDLLFWFLAGWITFLFLLLFTEAQLRLYVLLGQSLGFLVYHFSLGELVIALFRRLIALVKRLTAGVYRRLIRPVFHPIFIRIRRRRTNATTFDKKITQKSKKHLPKCPYVLYNQSDVVDNTTNKKQK